MFMPCTNCLDPPLGPPRRLLGTPKRRGHHLPKPAHREAINYCSGMAARNGVIAPPPSARMVTGPNTPGPMPLQNASHALCMLFFLRLSSIIVQFIYLLIFFYFFVFIYLLFSIFDWYNGSNYTVSHKNMPLDVSMRFRLGWHPIDCS